MEITNGGLNTIYPDFTLHCRWFLISLIVYMFCIEILFWCLLLIHFFLGTLIGPQERVTFSFLLLRLDCNLRRCPMVRFVFFFFCFGLWSIICIEFCYCCCLGNDEHKLFPSVIWGASFVPFFLFNIYLITKKKRKEAALKMTFMACDFQFDISSSILVHNLLV